MSFGEGWGVGGEEGGGNLRYSWNKVFKVLAVGGGRLVDLLCYFLFNVLCLKGFRILWFYILRKFVGLVKVYKV